MPRKKAEETNTNVENVANDLISSLNKTLSEINGLEDLTGNEEIKCIPTGIDLLDEVLGGGIPVGKLCSMTGAAGSAKSTCAIQYIVGFQHYDPRAIGIFCDVEQAVSMKRLVELGCDPKRTVLYSNSELTMEKIASIVRGLAKSKILNKIKDVPCIVVWDSESVTPTAKSLEVTESSKVMGEHSRTLGFIMNQLIPIIAKTNITLVIISQLRDKISQPYEVRFDMSFGSNQKITGGSVMQYYPFNMCRTRNKGELDYDMLGIRGFKTEMVFLKNKNFAPKIPIQVVLDYSTGFSDFWTKENLIRESKCFITSGPKNALKNYKDFKFSRRDIKKLYDTDETFREKFEEQYNICKSEIQTNNPWDKNLQIKKTKEMDSDLSDEDQDIISKLDSLGVSSDEELNLDNL